MPSTIASAPSTSVDARATRNCSRSSADAVPDDVHPQIVRQRRGARQRQPGDDRQNRGKRDGRDEPEERRAADDLGQQRRRHVAAGVDRANRVLADQHHGAKPEDERQQIEEPDERRRVGHRLARGLRIGHGVEAHQDVRQAGRAEHQRQAERHRIQRIGHQPARREHAGAVLAGRRREQRRAD